MPHMNSNIPSNIYYASIDSSRTTSDINTFITLSNCLLKRIQKQGSKHKSITSILNKIFGKHFTVFNVSADTAANFIKLFSLPRIRTMHIHVCLLQSLFLLFVVCLLVCFRGYHVIITSVCHLSLFP